MKKAALIAFCAILSFTTCQTLIDSLDEPVISFNSVEILKVDLIGTQLLCKVRVENPNAFAIPFPEVGWELFINENSFISGVIKNNERLRAKGTTIVEIPVSVEYLEIFNTFASFKGRTSVDFKVALAVKFSLPVIGDRVWNFEPEVSIPLPQLPKLTMPSIRFGSPTLAGVEMVVSVNIENPNNFNLPSPKISYDFLINRNPFLRSSLGITEPLAANSVTPLEFRASINTADVIMTIASLITQREAACEFDMSFDWGIPAFGGETTRLQIPGMLPLR